jgi:hypothetical protein
LRHIGGKELARLDPRVPHTKLPSSGKRSGIHSLRELVLRNPSAAKINRHTSQQRQWHQHECAGQRDITALTA